MVCDKGKVIQFVLIVFTLIKDGYVIAENSSISNHITNTYVCF
jgi:hypothetical protein